MINGFRDGILDFTNLISYFLQHFYCNFSNVYSNANFWSISQKLIDRLPGGHVTTTHVIYRETYQHHSIYKYSIIQIYFIRLFWMDTDSIWTEGCINGVIPLNEWKSIVMDMWNANIIKNKGITCCWRSDILDIKNYMNSINVMPQ